MSPPRKGRETGPNNFPQRETTDLRSQGYKSDSTYIATLLYGSLATLDAAEIEKNLPQ